MSSVPVRSYSRPVVFHTGPMIRIEGLDDDQRDEIIRALTIPNPVVAQQRRFSGFVSRDVPRYLYGYVVDGRDLIIAPGYASAAREWLLSEGASVDVRYDQVRPIGTPYIYNGEDREYQSAAIDRAGTKRQGYFVAPCGSGKTDIGVQLIARWGLPTLVIVHTRELMRQWCDRIEWRLGFRPVTFGGGKKTPITGSERVIVATVQMLRRSPMLMAQLAVCRKHVIVDECHHTPASTFTNVLAKLNPWVRHGFTATERRADGLSAMLQWWIGPKLAEVSRDELERSGHIIRPTLRVITTRLQGVYDPEEPGDYTRLMRKLVDDTDRLELIAREIAVWHESGRVHVVLTGSIEYGERIYNLLRDPLKPVMCHGRLSKADRDEAFDDVFAKRANVIIATSLADEGLDIPMLSDLWLVTPTRSEAKTEQRVGRVCRPCDGKPPPRVHDFVDWLIERQGFPEQHVFVNQFKNRFYRCYRRIADFDPAQVKRVLGGAR